MTDRDPLDDPAEHASADAAPELFELRELPEDPTGV